MQCYYKVFFCFYNNLIIVIVSFFYWHNDSLLFSDTMNLYINSSKISTIGNSTGLTIAYNLIYKGSGVASLLLSFYYLK
jgi:hypothetical protein